MPVKPEPYDVGDEVTLELAFVDALDAPKDPTDIVLELACPDGTLLTWSYAAAELVRAAQGIYRRVYVIANGSGRYFATGRGTGALPIVQRRTIQVRDPA